MDQCWCSVYWAHLQIDLICWVLSMIGFSTSRAAAFAVALDQCSAHLPPASFPPDDASAVFQCLFSLSSSPCSSPSLEISPGRIELNFLPSPLCLQPSPVATAAEIASTYGKHVKSKTHWLTKKTEEKIWLPAFDVSLWWTTLGKRREHTAERWEQKKEERWEQKKEESRKKRPRRREHRENSAFAADFETRTRRQCRLGLSLFTSP